MKSNSESSGELDLSFSLSDNEGNDDDEVFIDEDGQTLNSSGYFDSNAVTEQRPYTILSLDEFIKYVLDQVASTFEPYIYADDKNSGEYKWKCLALLYALDWNFSGAESIFNEQEKIFAKAGILVEPKPPKEPKRGKVSCSVCADRVKEKDSSYLECGHRFCNDCWSGSINTVLTSFSFETLLSHLHCMHKDCKVSINGSLIQKLVTEKEWIHFQKMVARAFISGNRASYSFCPRDGCGKYACANSSKNASTCVGCSCGTQYCFKCTMAPHVPCSCQELEEWKAKDSNEEASLNFIKATTTLCPSCSVPLDRTTACNHISCKCGHDFCFICRQKWGACSYYSCANFKTKEESVQADGEFAPGFATPSEWLISHERYVAFSSKYLAHKVKADNAEENMKELEAKSLAYREIKIGGNPAFITSAGAVLIKAHRILQHTFVWGYNNIPAKVCAQKQIFEMQIKNYEKMCDDLATTISEPAETIDHLDTKRKYTALEKNLILPVEDSDQLLSLFSVDQIGDGRLESTLGRWTCPDEGCNYSNHPETQADSCGHCGKARPEIKLVWFA